MKGTFTTDEQKINFIYQPNFCEIYEIVNDRKLTNGGFNSKKHINFKHIINPWVAQAIWPNK